METESFSGNRLVKMLVRARIFVKLLGIYQASRYQIQEIMVKNFNAEQDASSENAELTVQERLQHLQKK